MYFPEIVKCAVVHNQNKKYKKVCDIKGYIPIITNSVHLTEYEKIKDHIMVTNVASIENIKNTIFKSDNFAIDGVCCTGKTTGKNLTARNYVKYNECLKSEFFNQYALTHIGYIEGALKFANIHNNCIFDRNIYNNTDWTIIWSILVKQLQPNNLYKVVYDTINEMYPSDIFNMLFNIMPCVIIVDSNFEYNLHRLKARNTNSDAERANMEFYIPVQYIYYTIQALKNPNAILVDLANYNHDFNLIYKAIFEIMDDIKVQKEPIIYKSLNTNNFPQLLDFNALQTAVNYEEEREEYKRFLSDL